MSNIKEQQFVDNTKNKFGPTTGGQKFGPTTGNGGGVNFGPTTGGQKFGPTTGNGGGNKFGPTTPTAPTADPFACVSKNTDLKVAADKKSGTHVGDNGDVFTFYSDGSFTYKYKSGGNTDKGTWVCDGTDYYKITMDDGDVYDKKTNKWTDGSSSSNSSSNPGGSSSSSSSSTAPAFTNTSLTIDDLKAGKEVSKGMKGAVVGEIQKLLIAAGYKNISKSGNVDNRFGNRTKTSVEKFQTDSKIKVDGIVGDETINALLKATPASSSTSEDPNKKPFDPNAEEDNSIPSTDGALIKEKEKVLQESLKKMLRNSLLKYS
jgi:hypothetical protein